MIHMFDDCDLLEIDLSSFNTENVEDMSYMFNNSNKIKKLNLSMFDTRRVKVMGSMLYECNNLTDINLSSFNTKNAQYMNHLYFMDARIYYILIYRHLIMKI